MVDSSSRSKQAPIYLLMNGPGLIIYSADILPEIESENHRDKLINYIFPRYFTLVIGVNKALLVKLIACLPELES